MGPCAGRSRPGYLRHVQVSRGVDGYPVGRIEPPRLVAVALAPDPGQDLPFGVNHRDAGSEIGADVVGGNPAKVLADVYQFLARPVVDADGSCSREVAPLGLVLPV